MEIKPHYLKFKDLDKYADALQNHMYTCKCGHRVFIRKNEIKSICNWCNRSVYKSKQDEFKDKLGVKLYGRNFRRKD